MFSIRFCVLIVCNDLRYSASVALSPQKSWFSNKFIAPKWFRTIKWQLNYKLNGILSVRVERRTEKTLSKFNPLDDLYKESVHTYNLRGRQLFNIYYTPFRVSVYLCVSICCVVLAKVRTYVYVCVCCLLCIAVNFSFRLAEIHTHTHDKSSIELVHLTEKWWISVRMANAR